MKNLIGTIRQSADGSYFAFYLFLENEYNSLLENHPLAGKYEGFRSLNITRDFRAIYYRLGQDAAVFVNI